MGAPQRGAAPAGGGGGGVEQQQHTGAPEFVSSTRLATTTSFPGSWVARGGGGGCVEQHTGHQLLSPVSRVSKKLSWGWGSCFCSFLLLLLLLLVGGGR